MSAGYYINRDTAADQQEGVDAFDAAYVARWKVQRLIRETFDRLSVARDPGLERRGSPLPPSEGSPVLPRQNKALA